MTKKASSVTIFHGKFVPLHSNSSLNSYSNMNNVSFPNITTTVQAEPWAEGHVARITPTRAMPAMSRQRQTIKACILPR